MRLWLDPLTRKTFRSEQTYQAHTRSRKYADLVRKSGQAAPAPLVVHKPLQEVQEEGGWVVGERGGARRLRCMRGGGAGGGRLAQGQGRAAWVEVLGARHARPGHK